jgi:hypothetical protein
MNDIAGAGALVGLLSVLWVAYRKVRADGRSAVLEVDLPQGPHTLPEPPVVVGGNGQVRALAPRENRALILRERTRQRTCAYCDGAATAQKPLIVQDRSAADWLYVALGATPPTRWRVVLHPDPTRFPESLCAVHAEIVRGRQEKFLAALMVEQAEMLERQRMAVFEFQEHGLDEDVERAMAEIRKRKPGGAQ